jgi:very-short-patch-repair endonuclease
MGWSIVQRLRSGPWALAARQHGVISRRQLLELGLSPRSIEHRLATGRLHQIWRGVYAVGRPELSQRGRWMAAVLSCGPKAALSHGSAGTFFEILPARTDLIEVSVPAAVRRRQPGIVVHRRKLRNGEVEYRHGIPVTTPITTLIDLAARLDQHQLERGVNEADKRGLTDPEELRLVLEEIPRRPGVKPLRELLDRHTFVLTDSELERRFIPIARSAGLSLPETQCMVNGYRVDFYWPELGLVVETDGLRYHRTPAQQARDRVRDQTHMATGLTPLRFTRAQVRFEPEHVRATLAAVAPRLISAR